MLYDSTVRTGWRRSALFDAMYAIQCVGLPNFEAKIVNLLSKMVCKLSRFVRHYGENRKLV